LTAAEQGFFLKHMPKETFYFQHDYGARNDDKILQLRSSKFGNEGVAVYWYCLETMAERGDGIIDPKLLGGLSLGYGVATGWLSEFLEFCVTLSLFTKNNEGGYTSERMVSHLKLRKSLSAHGLEGAKARWKKANGHPNAPPNAPPNAKERKGKERKGKEIKEKNIKKILFPISHATMAELGVVDSLNDTLVKKSYPSLIDEKLKHYLLEITAWLEKNNMKREITTMRVLNWLKKAEPSPVRDDMFYEKEAERLSFAEFSNIHGMGLADKYFTV
jgi:hypothetical protein